MRRQLFLMLCISLVLASCSDKPPHVGVFLRQGNSLVEMARYNGGPDSSIAEGIPLASDSHPQIVMWNPEVNLDLLVLSAIGSSGTIAFDVSPQTDEILQIRFVEPLADGAYCFSQGNISLPHSLIPYWCFRVGEDIASFSADQFASDEQALPPGNGIFVVKNGEPVALSQLVIRIRSGIPEGLPEILSFPSVENSRPIVLAQSPDVQPSNISLYYLRPGAGFTCREFDSQAFISRVQSNSGAEKAGLQNGDIIVAVNGQEVSGDCETVVSLGRGPLGGNFSVSVLRGTFTTEIIATRETIVAAEIISFSYDLKGQYAQFTPDQFLEPGVYCYIQNLNGWCFEVR